MIQSVECVRCHVQMEKGFVIDGRHSGYAQQQWAPGEPKPSFWTGLELSSNMLLSVATWRCPACGRLASYAIRDEDKLNIR